MIPAKLFFYVSEFWLFY